MTIKNNVIASETFNDNCVMLSVSETSPGKAKPADFMLSEYSLYGKIPFREYALPLKRERWHVQRAEEGATCLGGFGRASE